MRYRLPLLNNKDMKKIIILAVLALLLQSCDKYSTQRSDEDPQVSSVEYLQSYALSGVFGVIKLADFFDNYQKIREDRDAAIALGKEYFGERFYEDKLTFEKFESGLGTIRATTTPGLYKVTYYDANGERTLYAQVLEDRQMQITSKVPRTKDVGPTWVPFELEVECIATVTPENIAVIENLDLNYREESAGKVTTARITSTPDPAEVHIRQEYRPFYPFSGILDYKIGGDVINDEFSVRFSEDKFDII